MRIMLTATCLTLSISGCATHAATLAGDTLVCEDAAVLRSAIEEKLTEKGGAEALRQAGLSAQFYELQAKQVQIMRGLAADEESILARSRIRSPNSTARSALATDEARSAGDKVALFKQINATCASSGPKQANVGILERKPISGVARISLRLDGSAVEVWAPGAAIAEQ